VDVLSDVLGRARARGALFGHWRLSCPWGLDFDDGDAPLSLHTVLAGELTCEREKSPAARVRQGDLVLVRGGRYRFVHEPGAAARPVAEVLAAGPAPGTARTYVLGDGHGTELLCGAYAFDGGLWPAVVAALPAITIVASAGNRPLSTLLALMAEEIRSAEPGQQTVLDRLLDLLLVAALRAHWTAPQARAPSWFRALSDPVAGPALSALHEAPSRSWTVADLADRAGVSRATLARRFAAATGLPPLAYLTRWRMELAKDELERPDTTIASIARATAYADEFSFAAAFKREVGVAPGRYRARRTGPPR
jgi:AraC-like DNA-binding protein